MDTLTLSDTIDTYAFNILEPPIPEKPIEYSVDVVTLDNNVSTYFTGNKRLWSHTWAFMDANEFEILKGFYDRQFTEFKYPKLSIGTYNVSNVSVRMTIDSAGFIDVCGTREAVTVTFREAR